MGISVEQFITQLVNQSNEDYINAFGFIPGPGIRSALKNLLTRPGELLIVVKSGGSFDFATLKLYKPEEIPEIIGLSVSVNGKAVDDLSFAMDESLMKRRLKSGIDTSSGQNRKAALPTIESQAQLETFGQERKYIVVRPSQVYKMIGQKAHLKINNGKTRSGKIVRVENEAVTLKIRMFGGTVSISFPLQDISYIEVQELL